MKDPLVRAEGLRKWYGRSGHRVDVLTGVDLTLDRGEVLALLGPNGAGKTTTVRILTTLLRPDGGTGTIGGYDVVGDARRVREIISLTGQYAAVDEKQTGRENLTMMGRLAHLPHRTVTTRVDDLLSGFDLVDAADRRVDTYSGGMRRRLDLAAGLLIRPQVLFLDEPTTGLDPRSRQTMWEVIRSIVADGTSLFLTTQYLEEADLLADRIALIDGGRVAAEGTAAQLKRQVGEANIEFVFDAAVDAQRVGAALTAHSPIIESRTIRIPTDGSLDHSRTLLDAVAATGATPAGWDLRAPTLDDVFLALTGHGTTTIDATEETAA
ncbi:daunorubicin resistance protein DrrA family ABC transporter ATP-binding protein [Gordonia soli]|uniref:Putative ABC transporter ATP-binding protein n=1 Tax=Gordonia soli NBRC 108243 TaxID=1223545 RepID=M0QLL3_9ACTN|nr:daunorubicin resistance protein DrrA family ABC transporter ATP-binding protein [Gordonia soli]GAC69196.1 putative ABC transporter ATP-binding protein [Gordonia soli NBRC 108243]